MGLLLVIPLFPGKSTGSGLWMAGFTGSSMEVLLLMVYQTLYGHLYQMTSLVFGVFMAGLALASVLSGYIDKTQKKFYIMNQFIMGIYCLVFPVILLLLHKNTGPEILLHIIIFSLTFLIALLSGLQFILSARLRGGTTPRTAGIAYSLDLLGAAAGALFVSALLLPIFGMVKISILIALLNFITGIFLLMKRKKL
jgi:predicted membrane-bound spermidine synthase